MSGERAEPVENTDTTAMTRTVESTPMADSAQSQPGSEGPAKLRSERMFSGLTLPLIALTVPLSVWGVLRAAADPADHSLFTAFLIMGTPMIPTAWAVLRVLGGGEPPRAPFQTAALRVIVIPLVAAWPPAIAVAITLHVPAVQARILATRDEDGDRFFFGGTYRDGSLLRQAFELTGGAGLVYGMLLALALLVAVVLQVIVWRRPLAAASENMLDVESVEGRAAASTAMRWFAALILLVFLVPTLLTVGARLSNASSRGEAFANAALFFVDPRDHWPDLMWVIGLLLVPLGVLALAIVKLVQRPNKQLRAKHGLNARDDEQPGER